MFLIKYRSVSLNIYHLINLVIQSQFWAASTRTFSETFPQNGHRTDDQRSVSTILKECLGQLPGPSRRKPTETDRKRRDRTDSASSTRVGLASIATSSDPDTFYLRQSKNRRDQSSFRGAESQRPNCSTFPSLQRNGLPPPQHNLVEVRLSPPPPMATRRRTMEGRFAS